MHHVSSSELIQLHMLTYYNTDPHLDMIQIHTQNYTLSHKLSWSSQFIATNFPTFQQLEQQFEICSPPTTTTTTRKEKKSTLQGVCSLCRAGANWTQESSQFIFLSIVKSVKPPRNPPLKLDANEVSSGFPRRTLWNWLARGNLQGCLWVCAWTDEASTVFLSLTFQILCLQ